MNESLFLEVLNVKGATEVKKAYDKAVAENKKYYRCATEANKTIGWHENFYITADTAMKRAPETIVHIDGKIWFVNPHYKDMGAEIVEEPANVQDKPIVAADFSPIKPGTTAVKAGADIFTQVAKAHEELQNKYDEMCGTAMALRQQLQSKEEELLKFKAEYAKLKVEYDRLTDDEESAKERLEDLKDALETLTEFAKGASNE